MVTIAFSPFNLLESLRPPFDYVRSFSSVNLSASLGERFRAAPNQELASFPTRTRRFASFPGSFRPELR